MEDELDETEVWFADNGVSVRQNSELVMLLDETRTLLVSDESEVKIGSLGSPFAAELLKMKLEKPDFIW